MGIWDLIYLVTQFIARCYYHSCVYFYEGISWCQSTSFWVILSEAMPSCFILGQVVSDNSTELVNIIGQRPMWHNFWRPVKWNQLKLSNSQTVQNYLYA